MRRDIHLSKRIRDHRGLHTPGCWLLATLMAALFVWSGTPALAGPVSGSFKIDIGESERLLGAMVDREHGDISDAQFAGIQMEEMCRNPSLRLIDRNRPSLVLQNTSDPNTGNEISQFTIDLEEMGYEFGNGDFNPDPFAGALTILSNRSDSGISMSSSYGTVSDVDLTQDRSKLVLDINGLTPGKAMFFRLDLDSNPVTTMAFPDYQHVMLGGDLGDGNGPADPALISAVFAAGEGSNRMTSATEPSQFDPGIDKILDMAGMIEGYHSQSYSEFYSATGGTDQIPEPATAMLMLAGAIAVGASRCSRRR